ncbi:MAG: hypothetical protein IJE44_04635 [Clostridia bacterium]|nr:hypothetical protein [Clostridia bacterium]
MDVLTVNPGMLYKTVDFGKFKSEEEKDFFASLFLVAGAIGNEISCQNIGFLGEKSSKIIEIIKSVGGEIEEKEGLLRAKKNANMRGTNISCTGYEDILPFIALLCAFCIGESRLTGVKNTKYVSLLRGIAAEFSHLGVYTKQTVDGLIIHGGQVLRGDGAYVWNSAPLAMALLVGASRSEGEMRICGVLEIEEDKRFEKLLKILIGE